MFRPEWFLVMVSWSEVA